MHLEPVYGRRLDPMNLARLAARRGLSTRLTAGQNDRELLPNLVVARVVDDVARVGVDPVNAGDLTDDPGLFDRFANGSVDHGFAQVDSATWYSPVAVIGSSDHENPASIVNNDHVDRGNQAVRGRRVGVV